MPKYNVQLTRDIQETAWIEVEADDMVGAEAAALAMAERLAPSEDGEETDPKIKWDRLQLDEAEITVEDEDEDENEDEDEAA